MMHLLHRRILLSGMLVLTLIGASSVYASQPPNPDANVFPRNEDFVEDHEAYIGQRVLLSGTIEKTSPLVVQVETTQGSAEFKVTSVERRIQVSAQLDIFGIAKRDHTIQAIGVRPTSSGEREYVYGISLLAVLWVSLRFLHHWKLDVESWSIKRTTNQEEANDA